MEKEIARLSVILVCVLAYNYALSTYGTSTRRNNELSRPRAGLLSLDISRGRCKSSETMVDGVVAAPNDVWWSLDMLMSRSCYCSG